jgi:hypothetical protein
MPGIVEIHRNKIKKLKKDIQEKTGKYSLYSDTNIQEVINAEITTEIDNIQREIKDYVSQPEYVNVARVDDFQTVVEDTEKAVEYVNVLADDGLIDKKIAKSIEEEYEKAANNEDLTNILHVEYTANRITENALIPSTVDPTRELIEDMETRFGLSGVYDNGRLIFNSGELMLEGLLLRTKPHIYYLKKSDGSNFNSFYYIDGFKVNTPYIYIPMNEKSMYVWNIQKKEFDKCLDENSQLFYDKNERQIYRKDDTGVKTVVESNIDLRRYDGLASFASHIRPDTEVHRVASIFDSLIQSVFQNDGGDGGRGVTTAGFAGNYQLFNPINMFLILLILMLIFFIEITPVKNRYSRHKVEHVR